MCAGGKSFCAADIGKATAITAWEVVCWKWEGRQVTGPQLYPTSWRSYPDGDLCGVMNQHGNPKIQLSLVQHSNNMQIVDTFAA